MGKCLHTLMSFVNYFVSNSSNAKSVNVSENVNCDDYDYANGYGCDCSTTNNACQQEYNTNAIFDLIFVYVNSTFG